MGRPLGSLPDGGPREVPGLHAFRFPRSTARSREPHRALLRAVLPTAARVLEPKHEAVNACVEGCTAEAARGVCPTVKRGLEVPHTLAQSTKREPRAHEGGRHVEALHQGNWLASVGLAWPGTKVPLSSRPNGSVGLDDGIPHARGVDQDAPGGHGCAESGVDVHHRDARGRRVEGG